MSSPRPWLTASATTAAIISTMYSIVSVFMRFTFPEYVPGGLLRPPGRDDHGLGVSLQVVRPALEVRHRVAERPGGVDPEVGAEHGGPHLGDQALQLDFVQILHNS